MVFIEVMWVVMVVMVVAKDSLRITNQASLKNTLDGFLYTVSSA